MFRDILVVLGAVGSAANQGLALARDFDAEITAVGPARPVDFDPFPDTEALRDFAERAAALRIDAHVVTATDFERRDPARLPRLARLFDLVVIEQPAPRSEGVALGGIVAGCGRPVLAIPYIQKQAASFDSVVVAWDASASAARALGDATPLLRRARSVEVVTVMNDGVDRASPRGDEVVSHLARRGIAAAFRPLPGGIGAADMLLSYVADRGANLMVTGGWGHSRLAETIIGGATRTLLETMTIPLFMAH
jgi:nucleotide-binding universal stress UspA family protein